jgi:hypothetical protein
MNVMKLASEIRKNSAEVLECKPSEISWSHCLQWAWQIIKGEAEKPEEKKLEALPKRKRERGFYLISRMKRDTQTIMEMEMDWDWAVENLILNSLDFYDLVKLYQ